MSKKAFCVYCFSRDGKRAKYQFDFLSSWAARYFARKLARLEDCKGTEVVDWCTGEIVAIYDGEAIA